jgi:hypothetical protein
MTISKDITLNRMGPILTTEVSKGRVHGMGGLMDKVTDYSLAPSRTIEYDIFEGSLLRQMEREN